MNTEHAAYHIANELGALSYLTLTTINKILVATPTKVTRLA